MSGFFGQLGGLSGVGSGAGDCGSRFSRGNLGFISLAAHYSQIFDPDKTYHVLTPAWQIHISA